MYSFCGYSTIVVRPIATELKPVLYESEKKLGHYTILCFSILCCLIVLALKADRNNHFQQNFTILHALL